MKHPCSWLVMLAVMGLSYIHATAQNTCGFDDVNRKLQRDNPHFKEMNDRFKKRAGGKVLGGDGAGGDMLTIYKIPVVVHVISKGEALGTGTNISDEQVISAIEAMTKYYRAQLGNSIDAHIEFELAKINPSCNISNGIQRIDGSAINGYLQNGLTNSAFPGLQNELDIKAMSNWANVNYCNIWVVSEINGNDGGAGTQGFTYLPGAPANIDGIVVLYNAFGYDPDGSLGYHLKPTTRQNKIVTHEMGHELGLYHTFEGDDSNFDGIADMCPVNDNCAEDGDGVCDTGPQERSLSDCPAIPYGNCSADLNVVKNYMDYSSETCQDRFTWGQVVKMRAAILEFRSTLLHSRALSNTITGPVGATANVTCTPATSTIGMSGYFAAITNVSINERNFVSAYPKDDNPSSGFLDALPACLNIVTLYKGSTNQFKITVAGKKNEQLRAWIDFNNDGLFDNNTEQIYINTRLELAPDATVAGSFVVPHSAVEDVVLRLRIIDDYSSSSGFPVQDILSACTDPTYGQAEDYPIMVSAASPPLPVTLLSFTAKPSNDDVHLQWVTTKETDNKGFTIERSDDGIHFTDIAFVKAGSHASGNHHYTYVDKNVTAKILYYRLRQMDIDGGETISQVVSVQTDCHNNDFVLLKNPFGSSIDFTMKDRAQQLLNVNLVDMSGRLVEKWSVRNENDSAVRLDTSNDNIQSGMYILTVQSIGKVYVRKVIKL